MTEAAVEAIEAARAAGPGWVEAGPYRRGRAIFRLAGAAADRRADLAGAIRAAGAGGGRAGARREVQAAVDRLRCFAGWAVAHAEALGAVGPREGPLLCRSDPRPVGVVAVAGPASPPAPPLLAILSLLAPPLCAGNTVVAIAERAASGPAALLGELAAAGALPAGVLAVIGGSRSALLPALARHEAVAAIAAANQPPSVLRRLRAPRPGPPLRVHAVRLAAGAWFEKSRESPRTIEPFLDMQTVWQAG